jgi:preprotein translocase subunit SecD
MKKKVLWRIILIVILVGLCAYSIYPPEQRINLGLDLKGGSHLLLQVNTEDAVDAEIDQARERLVNELIDESIRYRQVKRLPDGKIEILSDSLQKDAIEELLDERFPSFDYSYKTSPESKWVLSLKEIAGRDIEEKTVKQTLNTLTTRVDEFGVEEPTIQRHGLTGNRILLELPGLDDPERIKEKIKTVAQLEWREVLGGPFESRKDALAQLQGKLPEGSELLPESIERQEQKLTRYYLLKKSAVITGKDLKNARRGVDETGLPAVHFSLSAEGTRIFSRYTADHIGDLLSIVLDNKIYSVATIRSQITGNGQIEGNFTQQEAEDLALLLRAGALPASMTYIEERTIGPYLGRDSIRLGIVAAISGLLLVLAFMLIYYKKSGINAMIALIFNIIIVLGVLAYFRATLTLPGIAGFILTIGMAVDANVLIFERIREERRLGKTIRSSVDGGFGKAFWTIFDANTTTLIAAVFLFQFGTGPIKGFAVTLSVGILASMFTAIFVSRTIFEVTLFRRGKRAERISI